MKCPRCRALVIAEDVDLAHLLAKCRECQEVFRFAAEEIEAVSDRLLRQLAQGTPAKALAPQPQSISVDPFSRQMTKRWFEWHYVFLALFCVFWNGFFIFWYATLFAAWRDDGVDSGMWLAALFPLGHLIVGVWITYTTLAGFVNWTVVAVADSMLQIEHGPLPWLGNLSVAASSIRQLYCMETTNKWSWPQGYWATTVKLSALLQDGREQTIWRSLSREEGLFIEQKLEQWLEIKPRRVPGQVD